MFFKNIVIAAVLLSVSVCYATADEWTLINAGTRGHGQIEKVNIDGQNGFKMSILRNIDGNTYATALLDTSLNEPAIKKLWFRYRGSRNSSATVITPVLVMDDGKHYYGPSLKTDSDSAKNACLSLSVDFKLSDRLWSIKQIKFIINNTNEKQGHTGTVEIADVRIVSADEVAATSGSSEIVVYPVNVPAEVVNNDAIKIYFDYDNEDLSTEFSNRFASGVSTKDNKAYAGFRAMLIEKLPRQAVIVQEMTDADVIVYGRTTKSHVAAQIAAAVKSGKNLLVTGDVPDDEILELLPVKLNHFAMYGLPVRQKLQIKNSTHPILAGQSINPAGYGIYRNSAMKNGDVLIAFDSGMPAVAEGYSGKGKVIYSMLTTGAGLLQDSAFYDLFTLRTIGYLSGKKGALDKLELLSIADRADDIYAKSALTADVLESAKIASGKNTLAAHYSALKKAVELENIAMAAQELSAMQNAASAICRADNLQYETGMSVENFGRFGYLVGEGLLCDNLTRWLSVTNGSQEYRFGSGTSPKISIFKWNTRGISGAAANNPKLIRQDVNFDFTWNDIGIVEYSAQIEIPPEWKGKDFYFEVEKGIDDLDQTWFNGIMIGETTKAVKNYWEAPRKYKIPADAVKFGAINEIKILLNNTYLSGSINSVPRITVRDSKSQEPEKLVYDSIDWTHKSGVITGANGDIRRLTMSLLYPFIRYDFNSPKTTLALENVAEFAAWRTKEGTRIADLTGSGDILYSLKRDGAWSAPWLLLWSAKDSRPLLLVFEHQVEEINIQRAGRIVNSLTFMSANNLGAVVAGWPWGKFSLEKTEWNSRLPDDVLKRITDASAKALNFPVGCDEIFAIDKSAAKIRIISRTRHQAIKDDWNTPKKPYAILPPLAAYAQGLLVDPVDNLTDYGIVTKYGPLCGIDGQDTVAWSLPVPALDSFSHVNVNNEPEISALVNEAFSGGIKWSSGGSIRMEDWTPAAPTGKYAGSNVDLFAWCFGLGPSLAGSVFLSPSNLALLQNRVRIRYMEPIERFQFKAATRWRQEPFSGIRYPLYFNSYYPHNTVYAAGFGSNLDYGDENEACFLIVNIAQQLADHYGQSDLIRGNWNFYKQAMRFMLVGDDWAFHASSCRETGTGAYIDMLNCEYGAMTKFARLAQIAGDDVTYRQALYRGAKRMLPSVMRLYFTKYIKQHNLINNPDSISIVTGFGENEGPDYFQQGSGKALWANEIFDSTQGIPEELILLYKRYANDAVVKYINESLVPDSIGKDGKTLMSTECLIPLGYFGYPADKMKIFAHDSWEKYKNRYLRDWVGINIPRDFSGLIFRRNPDVFITRCMDLNLSRALFNPVQNRVELNCRAEDKGELRIYSARMPDKLEVDGVPVKPLTDPVSGELILPVRPGNNAFIVSLGDTPNPVRHIMLKTIKY